MCCLAGMYRARCPRALRLRCQSESNYRLNVLRKHAPVFAQCLSHVGWRCKRSVSMPQQTRGFCQKDLVSRFIGIRAWAARRAAPPRPLWGGRAGKSSNWAWNICVDFRELPDAGCDRFLEVATDSLQEGNPQSCEEQVHANQTTRPRSIFLHRTQFTH